MRVTLADGSHVLARYPKKQEPQTVTRLEAHGVAVTVLSKHDAEKEAGAKKPSHHKIRYIVGGVLVLVDRDRCRRAGGQPPPPARLSEAVQAIGALPGSRKGERTLWVAVFDGW